MPASAAPEPPRACGLEEDYTSAWQEWDESGDARLWDRVAGDGDVGRLPVRFPPETSRMPAHPVRMTTYTPLPIPETALQELRLADDSGRAMEPFAAGSERDRVGSVGSPLRCCLRGVEEGERVALVSYAPLRRWAEERWARPGAYDECGPVFVHAGECGGPDGSRAGYPFARPGALRTLRRYDADGHIVGGRFFEIPEDADAGFDAALAEAFEQPDVVLVHVRALEYGCFHFEVRRP